MESIYLPIEGEFVNTQSRYRLAILAAQRARQLIEGDRPTVETRNVKPTSVALEEILKGDLKILYGKEALRSQDEAIRIRREKKSRYLPEREEELRREIKKDLSIYLADSQEKESSSKADVKEVERIE